MLIPLGFITTTSSSAAPCKNFPAELRTTLDALKSDIAKSKSKSNGVKQGNPASGAEEINQGVIYAFNSSRHFIIF
jgi:hypothetical protein